MVRLATQEPLELQFRQPLVERVQVGAQMFLGLRVVRVDDPEELLELDRFLLGLRKRNAKPFEELELLNDGVAVAVLGPKIGIGGLALEFFYA